MEVSVEAIEVLIGYEVGDVSARVIPDAF